MTIRTFLLASAALAAGLSTPAFAQAEPAAADTGTDSAANPGDIVVTGSRIRRQDLAGVGPATVVSAEQIENTGVVNIETVLQRLPANAGFAGNQTSAYWTGNGYGTAQVNLRGLGIKRTLVLLNGRRLVAGGTGANSSPDLNMIPVVALARTDVLKDGASAIYGADAMAGVVNLVTRTDYEGLGLSVRQGITGKGDGSDFTADLIWGVRNDRGGVMAAVTYQKTRAVNMATRAPCSSQRCRHCSSSVVLPKPAGATTAMAAQSCIRVQCWSSRDRSIAIRGMRGGVVLRTNSDSDMAGGACPGCRSARDRAASATSMALSPPSANPSAEEAASAMPPPRPSPAAKMTLRNRPAAAARVPCTWAIPASSVARKIATTASHQRSPMARPREKADANWTFLSYPSAAFGFKKRKKGSRFPLPFRAASRFRAGAVAWLHC